MWRLFVPDPASPFVSITRSVRARFERQPLRLAWGATWSVICGALAAWPGEGGGGDALVRAVATWFVAVPLFGTVWWVWLHTTRPRAGADEPMAEADAAPASTGSIPPNRAIRARRADEQADAVLGVVLAAVVATLLGPPVVTWLSGGVGVLVLCHRMRLLSPHGRGLLRSCFEIAWPGMMAWLALAGPVGVPAVLAVGRNALENAGAWWQVNWLFPTLLLAFTLIHYAATAADNRAALSRQRQLLGLGYLAAVVTLAASDQPWAAGAVALLFVVQWPFQALFQSGRVRWHFEATQGLAMLAMLVAALAASRAS